MPGYSQSAIAYWVGQAKDTTGTVTPYAAARSSTGGGVTWTSGQLWSETAREWAIRATDPGNLAHSKALNQDWATSASQWKANHDTEWQNARDPQGYAYSYPGQAANAVFWSQSASYWKGQQDAWITNYNNAIASRDYWQHTVAHNDASVWDNRYNAGYNQGHVDGRNYVYGGLNNPEGESFTQGTYGMGSNGYTTAIGLNLPRTGHFVIGGYADGSGGLTSHGTNVWVMMRGLISQDKHTAGNNNNGTISFHAGWIAHGSWGASSQITIQCRNEWLESSSTFQFLYAHFVPDVTYHNN